MPARSTRSACADRTSSWRPSRTVRGSATGPASTRRRTSAAWSSRSAGSPPISGSTRSSTIRSRCWAARRRTRSSRPRPRPGRASTSPGTRKVRVTWHTGEPGASIPATRAKIETAFGAKAYDLPGLTEDRARGASRCDARSGLTHVNEDYCYPEILDERGEPVRPGERGELVFTSLYRAAMPLIRYRTRDLVQVADRRCPCGRTLAAFEGGVLRAARRHEEGARRHRLPAARRRELVRPHADVDEFQIVFRRREGLDDILIRIDPSPALSLGERDEASREAGRRSPDRARHPRHRRGRRARVAPAVGPQGPARQGRADGGAVLKAALFREHGGARRSCTRTIATRRSAPGRRWCA